VKKPARRTPIACRTAIGEGALSGDGMRARAPGGCDTPDTDRKRPTIILVVHAVHIKRRSWSRRNRWRRNVQEDSAGGLFGDRFRQA
jgi:hypothetical protein